jgi:exonuclease III
MNVYGAPQEENREAFLTECASFCSKSKESYIAGGDFNVIRFSFEKNKNFHPNRFFGASNSIIHLYELRDLHISSGVYTWSNNQTHPTMEKLDRILISKDWETLFPTVYVYKLPRKLSDHNPLILASEQGSNKKTRKS